MNHKLEKPQRLLDLEGKILEAGWANKLIAEYSPFDVKASKIRIKEWDYYIIVDNRGFAFSTVISDNRYLGLANATLFDLNEGKKYDYVIPIIMPNGRLHMPTDSSKGDIFYRNSAASLAYYHEDGFRRLTGHYKATKARPTLDFDIKLRKFENDDTMVIATPWETDKKAFYYNQKINCMPAKGYIKFGDVTIDLNPERNFATLDWGRGVWTYENTWYWSSGNGYVNGKRFGFNLGYGFGDTTAASENMFFYDGKCHKLDRIRFDIPDDIMQPWKIISSDGRFDMDFRPVYDNSSNINALVIKRNAHQVFGKISGKAVLDDGTVLEIKNLLMFAERVINKN